MGKLAAPAAVVLAGALALLVAASGPIPSASVAGQASNSARETPVALTAPEASTTSDPAPLAGTPAPAEAPYPPNADADVRTGPIAIDPTPDGPPPVPSIGPSWGPVDLSSPTMPVTPAPVETPASTSDATQPAAPTVSAPPTAEPSPAPTAPAVGPQPPAPGTSEPVPTQPTTPPPSVTPGPTHLASEPATPSPTPSASATPSPAQSPTATPSTAPFPGKNPAGDANLDNGALALLPDDNTAAILTVFNAINSYRASLGLAPVKYHATVAGMAQEWSNNIATREVIQHRPNFWTDPRAMNPNNGAGEVIAVRWDRDAALLVEWWKGSPGHDAMLRDPRFNVMGIGITYTDGNWQTTPNRYTLWGVVNFFGYTTLPAGTTDRPGGTVQPPTDPVGICEPDAKHQPPTVNLSTAAIRSAAEIVAIKPDGTVLAYPSLGNAKYGTPRTIGVGFTGLKELFVSDWDRDGVFDLIAQREDGALLVYPGRQAGGFGSPGVLGQGWQSLNIAVGNWCANNRIPQIVAMDTSGRMWFYKNSGLSYIRTQAAIGTGNPSVRLSMVDYNADGFQDLLSVEANGYLRLYRGSGIATPRQESRPVVGAAWTDYTGVRALRGVTGADTTGVAGLDRNGTLEYWDLTTGKLTTPVTVGTTWGGLKLAQ
ncbi:CAP domain-containing protein [Paenarthrobacter sp. NPDC092416]|uniref:CAP domain-containing protein n=1 Tax=Paenarthrobacter sp. NPDC092416 TaxID=3364386 RepID=UPI0037F7F14B